MPPFGSDCSWFDQIGFQPQSERQGSRTCPAPIPPVFSKKQLRRKINVIFQKNARSENPEPRLSERRAKKTKRERTHKACFGFSIRNTRHASARSERVRLCARPAVRFYKAGKPETGRYGPAAEPLSKIGTYRIPYARNGKQKKTVKEKRTFRKTTKVRKWFRTFVFHKAPVVRHRFSH